MPSKKSSRAEQSALLFHVSGLMAGVDEAGRGPLAGPVVAAAVKGDALVPAISAASILAKVHRDRLCQAMHQQYPLYGFDQHKGYGTAQHLAALQAHGPADCHRMTFAPVARSVR